MTLLKCKVAFYFGYFKVNPFMKPNTVQEVEYLPEATEREIVQAALQQYGQPYPRTYSYTITNIPVENVAVNLDNRTILVSELGNASSHLAWANTRLEDDSGVDRRFKRELKSISARILEITEAIYQNQTYDRANEYEVHDDRVEASDLLPPSEWTTKVLKHTCKINNVKGYSLMTREELIKTVETLQINSFK